MKFQHSNQLSALLITHQLIKPEQLEQAVHHAKNANLSLISYLVEHQLIDAKDIAKLMSQVSGIPIFDLDTLQSPPQTQWLDDKIILKYRILPLSKTNQGLKVATSDVLSLDVADVVRFHTQLQMIPVLVEEDKLSARLARVISGNIELDEDNEDDFYEDEDIETQDAPTIKFVHKILTDAIKLGASDVHFEPYEKNYRIRYRIDGSMQIVSTPPINSANKLVARLKVMAKLDISERRKPQDGRLKLVVSEALSVDFRVSTLPTLFGEKIVLRLLDSKQALIGLDSLGLTPTQKSQFLHALNKVQGMILITGPTGSGKTISLYTALGLLNRPDVNILTAEDPIEIHLDGVNQVNINPKIQLDFADALRAFLRQDPDVIMVGEIRDIPTAQIAIKAAQTGHLVLSTLHTNSAAQTLTRLHSMGIESFHLASSISLVIAQRLARRLCDHCKRAIHIPEQSLLEAGFSPEDIAENPTIYEAVGCHRCRDGYLGRVGLFECLPITPSISLLIMQQKSSHAIEHQSIKEGNLTLRQSGILKVKQGIISLQEMHRVTCS